MKRLICMVAIALIASAGAAMAQAPMHNGGGLGFHNSDAPIGVRWWLSGQKIALDAGVGVGSDDNGAETFSHWALDFGLPIDLRTWDKVHFMVRPGILYRSQEVTVTGGGKDSDTDFIVSGELEVEYFMADNLSISASHGISIDNFNPAEPGQSSTTSWGTAGNNFTSLGFHVYLFK